MNANINTFEIVSIILDLNQKSNQIVLLQYCEARQAYDVVSSLLHTVLFHRATGKVSTQITQFQVKL